MKQKIVISAGNNSFEFNGEILEMDENHLTVRADKGDIYIERKYLVFIQFLNEEDISKHNQKEVMPVTARSIKADNAARFINQRLKQDPLNEKIQDKLVPPSQLPDYNSPEQHLSIDDMEDEDMEAMRETYRNVHGEEHPFVKAANLKQAIRTAMEDSDGELSMGMGGVKYRDPLQTILNMKNANNKKTRTS